MPYASNLVFLSYRVLSFDFPTFEYRPLREFATNQALTFAVQLGWGVEFPNHVQYVSKLTLPAATGPVARPGHGVADLPSHSLRRPLLLLRRMQRGG